jgi:glutaredoxin 3
MITIYTTKTCGFCQAAKNYFNSRNIKYSEVDVGEDPSGAQKLIAFPGSSAFR